MGREMMLGAALDDKSKVKRPWRSESAARVVASGWEESESVSRESTVVIGEGRRRTSTSVRRRANNCGARLCRHTMKSDTCGRGILETYVLLLARYDVFDRCPDVSQYERRFLKEERQELREHGDGSRSLCRSWRQGRERSEGEGAQNVGVRESKSSGVS